MKEFYLVPKLTYDRLFDKTPSNIGGQVTLKTLKPPPIHKKRPVNKSVNIKKKKNTDLELVKLKQLKTQEVFNKVQRNPSLDHLINILLPSKDRTYGINLIKFIEENNSSIQWDMNGDLIEPIKNYNIIDFIRKLSESSGKIDDIYLNDYKYLFSTLYIPTWLIKNKEVIKQISSRGETKTKKKRWRSIARRI